MSMVDFRNLGEDLICLPQIGVEHVQQLADAGFKSLVCHRPDGEDGFAIAPLEEAARKAGLAFVHQPVIYATVNAQDGAAFVKTLDALPKPVAAYCRSGRRSAALWALGRAPAMGVEQALQIGREAGIDLEDIRSRMG
jgi:sulfide:quinone oxidoreductase